MRDLITGVAKYSPKAFIAIISNPVNSTVPIAAEVLKSHGVFDPARLFGVTTLDTVRSETFTAHVLGKSPTEFTIPVIGGHSGETIVPLLSLASPAVSVEGEQRDALIKRIQFGGDEVVQAKEGKGSATLSMAHAGFRFVDSILKAVSGTAGIVENTFVYLPGVEGGEAVKKITGVDYFALPVELGVSYLCWFYVVSSILIILDYSPRVQSRLSMSLKKCLTLKRLYCLPHTLVYQPTFRRE